MNNINDILLKGLNNVYYATLLIDLNNETYSTINNTPSIFDIACVGSINTLKEYMTRNNVLMQYHSEILSTLSKDNLINKFKDFTNISIDYQIIRNNEIRWDRLTIALVDKSDNGHPSHLLFLYNDITFNET